MAIVAPTSLQAKPETGLVTGRPFASSISDTILIDGNDDVMIHASGGSGTVEDPYVIENKVIAPSAEDSYETWVFIFGRRTVTFTTAVSIKNTDVAVLLRGITVDSSGVGDYQNYIPFFFENNSHVSMESLNVEYPGHVRGMSMVYMRGGDLDSPDPHGSYHIRDSSFIDAWTWFSSGDPIGNAIWADRLESIEIDTVEIYSGYYVPFREGFKITNVVSVTMRDVAFAGSSITMDAILAGTPGREYIHAYDIDDSNTVDGNPMLFLSRASGVEVTAPQEIGQLFIIECEDVLVQGVTAKGGSSTVIIWESANITFRNVHVTGACSDGITIAHGAGITIEDSLLTGNGRSGVIMGGGIEGDDRPVIIRNNIIQDHSRNIRLILIDNVLVEGNTISWSQEWLDFVEWAADMAGMPVEALTSDWMGIQMMTCNNVTITNNTIHAGHRGIDTEQFYSAGPVTNLTISNNRLLGSTSSPWPEDTHGIVMNYASDYEIHGNIVSGYNTGMALYGEGEVFWNDLVDNTVNIVASGDQVFHRDGKGNYYSDYESRYPDATNDGIVWDTPYEFSEWIGGPSDPYPLVNPNSVEETNPLDEIADLMELLCDQITSNLRLGRRVACLALHGLASRCLATMRAHEDLASIPACQITMMSALVSAIRNIARNSEITTTCNEILGLLETLKDL